MRAFVRDYIAARVDELTVITPEILDNFEPPYVIAALPIRNIVEIRNGFAYHESLLATLLKRI